MDFLLNPGDITNMLYFAYGMNTNIESMATRCPKAKYFGNYTLYKFLFQFRRVADIDYTGNKKDKVVGTVWDISKDWKVIQPFIQQNISRPKKAG